MALDWISLGKQAVSLGAPTIGAALGGPVGAQVGEAVAVALGVPATPDAVSTAVKADPGALGAIEADPPTDITEWLLIHARAAAALTKTESERETWFSWAWRPAMSWLLIVMWAWALLILPIVDAITRVGISPVSTPDLLNLSGIWMVVYGGGHTLKAVLQR